MKILLIVSVILITLTGANSTAFAQKVSNDVFDNQATSNPRFIEGIEIIRNPSIQLAEVNTEPGNDLNASSLKEGNHADFQIEESHSIQFKYALLMDRYVESISNILLYSFVDEWWNTRYMLGGSTKKGIDCSAFSSLLLKEVYGMHIARTAKEQYKATIKIDTDEIQEGDMVFFNSKGRLSHVGIYLGDGYFVHASTSSGVTINNLNTSYYKKRFKGAGRVIPASHDQTAGL